MEGMVYEFIVVVATATPFCRHSYVPLVRFDDTVNVLEVPEQTDAVAGIDVIVGATQGTTTVNVAIVCVVDVTAVGPGHVIDPPEYSVIVAALTRTELSATCVMVIDAPFQPSP